MYWASKYGCKGGKHIMLFMLCFCTVCVVPIMTLSYNQALVKEQYTSEINKLIFVIRVQFWKFAITGAENNSELKIWSCESWTCLQTIRFTPEAGKKDIVLKAGLDLGAGYLLLSDINYKVKNTEEQAL
jgi:hypothetical protein